MILLLTEGQVSDYRGAATVLSDLPEADRLIADKGYDSDWFREALTNLEITPCIPGRANRKVPIPYDAAGSARLESKACWTRRVRAGRARSTMIRSPP